MFIWIFCRHILPTPFPPSLCFFSTFWRRIDYNAFLTHCSKLKVLFPGKVPLPFAVFVAILLLYLSPKICDAVGFQWSVYSTRKFRSVQGSHFRFEIKRNNSIQCLSSMLWIRCDTVWSGVWLNVALRSHLIELDSAHEKSDVWPGPKLQSLALVTKRCYGAYSYHDCVDWGRPSFVESSVTITSCLNRAVWVSEVDFEYEKEPLLGDCRIIGAFVQVSCFLRLCA